MKNKKSFLKYIAYSVIGIVIIGMFGIVYLLYSFDLARDPVLEEMKRVTSPDFKVDAVLIEYLGGATGSNSYHVYLVPKGQSINNSHAEFVADHIRGLDIYWKANNFLVIQYEQARIFEFSNFWHSSAINDWSYVVELRLNPLTDSFSLSDSDRWLNINK